MKSRDTVDVELIAMFEQMENGKEDHKVLAVFHGEHWNIDEKTKDIFKKFTKDVFSHRPNHEIAIGRFLGKEEALALIEKSQDSEGEQFSPSSSSR